MFRLIIKLRQQAAALWTRSIDAPLKTAIDALKFSLERLLLGLFLGNPVGRWLYNHTTPNDWTATRLYLSWVPMALILNYRPLTAIFANLAIWSTDIIDGFLARTKNKITEDGKKYETTVDSIFIILTFVGTGIAYPDVRPGLALAGILEVYRLSAGLILRRYGYDGEPNRSGKVKAWAYAIGISLRLLAAPAATQIFLATGIALSVYSMTMHLMRFRTFKRH